MGRREYVVFILLKFIDIIHVSRAKVFSGRAVGSTTFSGLNAIATHMDYI
jgi:hypothetical protein